MSFNELLRKISEGTTFEKIAEQAGHTNVECCENKVFADSDLDDFLESIGATIDDFGCGYAVIIAGDRIYELPYELIPNRFDPDLDEEIIIDFKSETTYDVTDDHERLQEDDATKYKYEIFLDAVNNGRLVGTSGDAELYSEAEAQADADDYIISVLSAQYEHPVKEFRVVIKAI